MNKHLSFAVIVGLGTLSSALLLAHDPANAQTMYRCEVGGRTEFRQQPCEPAAKSERLQVRVAPGAPKPAPSQNPAVASSVAPAQAQSQQGQAREESASPPQPFRSTADRLADTCLDWYRPKLRDPRGAYHREATLEKNIVRMRIYATNGRGGYTDAPGACEFKSGSLDESWTKIHAKRLDWAVD